MATTATPAYHIRAPIRRNIEVEGSAFGNRQMRNVILSTLLAAAAAVVTSAAAATESFSAEFSVDYLGLTVAKTTVYSVINESGFEMQGEIKSAGLAKFFDSTHATTKVSGSFQNGAVRPNTYAVAYMYGKKAKQTSLGFANGAVAQVQNEPPLPARGADWVGITDASLRGVVDPLSATLVRASKAKVCNRTVSIFDGEIRADLVLTPLKANPQGLPDFAGGAVTCRAKFVPVAGYATKNSSVTYLRDKSRMNITFAPLGQTGVYAPVYATVGTKFGTVTISTKRISTH